MSVLNDCLNRKLVTEYIEIVGICCLKAGFGVIGGSNFSALSGSISSQF
jgi:hypothetical protein